LWRKWCAERDWVRLGFRNSYRDNCISRFSFLADDNMGHVGTHLEEYSYLGLNTVVKRAHPEPGIDLTYIAQSGDLVCVSPCDPGDQYTGLDRFGRVVETVTERFKSRHS